MTTFSVTIADQVIDCVDLSDQWKHSVVRHQYPGQNGAELEWMGAESGEFKLRTVFIGPAALASYTALLGVLRKGAIVPVLHPVHGQFDALVESVSAKYDHRLDTAEVDFSIVEHAVGKEIAYRPHAIDVAISTTQRAIDGGVCPDLAAVVSPATLPAISLADPAWYTKLAALGLGNKISGYVSKLAAEMGKVAGLRSALTSPVSAAFHALAFAADMPGQIAYQVAEFLDVFATGRIKDAPDPVLACSRLMADLRDLNQLFKGGSLENTVRVLGALQGARSAALVMSTDEENLRAQVALENSVTFDAQGNRIGSRQAAPVMPATPVQVGRLVTASRQLLSDALSYTTNPEPLEDLALALHRQYRDRLVRFELVREIVVAVPTPLHLICLQHKLSYNTAERLVRLNGMKNPSFTEGTVRIYAP